MTDEQINIAVTKACGWQQGNEPWKWIPPPGWLYSDSKFARAYLNSRDSPILAPPNYAGDLNATHEAEKLFHWNKDCPNVPSRMAEYARQLYNVIDNECSSEIGLEVLDPVEVASVLLHATARQRAIAFLKTLNLYHP